MGRRLHIRGLGQSGAADSQILSWNDTLNRWMPVSGGISASILDAKGDLIVATADDVPARLAVGSNGDVLTADSTASKGVKWAPPSISGTLPTGGTTGQVLTKNSAADFDTSWQTATGGGGSSAAGNEFLYYNAI